MVCNNWRFLHSNKRWCSLKGVTHVTQYGSVFDLCAGNRLWPLFSLNILLIIFELVYFNRNLHLSVNWSVFLTFDWYFQGPCLSQWVSQILRESVLFFPAPWSFFEQLALLLLLIYLVLHFELYHSVLVRVCYIKRKKHFSELLMYIISCILSWWISCGNRWNGINCSQYYC